MPLGTEDLIWVRRKIGTGTPTDDDLDDVYDRVGSREEVVKEVLETRLADLLANPAQFSVSGEYSQNTGANIAALQKALADPDLDPSTAGGVLLIHEGLHE